MFCGAYLADFFNKPFIVVHSGGLSVIGTFAQVPLPPSYVPFMGHGVTDEMTFLQRLKNLLIQNVNKILMDYSISNHFRSLQEEMGSAHNSSFSQLFVHQRILVWGLGLLMGLVF